MVVIDLGLQRDPGDPAETRRPGPSRRRSVVVALLVAVQLVVTASGPPPPAPLRAVFRVATTVGDTFVLAGDALLVARRASVGGGLVGYDLRTGALRWQAAVTPPTSYAVRRSGALLYVGERIGPLGRIRSVAVSAHDGAVLWRRAGRAVPVEGAGTVLAVSDVASLFGAGRRIKGDVVALDPGTGRVRWSVSVPSEAVLQPVPGSRPRILLVHDTGRAELRDLADGRTVAAVQLPEASYAPDNPTVVNGAVVLRHPTGTGTGITSYAPDTLERDWTRVEPARVDAVRTCLPMVCLLGRAGVRGVEPGDGTPRWFRPDWRVVEARGGYLQTYGPQDGEVDLLGLADPGTGRLVVDLRGWRVMPATVDADVLLSRIDDTAGRTVVGVVDPGSRTVRVLGALPPDSGDCRGGPGRLVCRAADGAVVGWDYASPVRR